jgi:hypothetical protein
MPTEKDIEVEARLVGLEFLVAQLFRIHYAFMNFSDAQVADERRKMRLYGQRLSVTGTGDAAMADHITGEIVEHIDVVLQTVEDLRNAYPKP